MRRAILLLAAFAVVGSSLAQDQGLTARSDALGGARWQARFERDDSALAWGARPGLALMARPSFAADGRPAPAFGAGAAQTLRLLGDYQLDTLRLGQTGGLRLTGGLLINLRGVAWAASEPTPTLPYAGIGYSSGSAPGSSGWQWGVSADLGLAASGLGVSLANRNGGTGLNVDGGLRDLRLQPMIRLGMNVAF